jgi:hypothetical protein
LSQVQQAYSSTSWTQNTNFLNTSNGIQLWTVPRTGSYTIQAVGASGGNPANFGRGRNISTTVTLIKGEVIQILVGQTGSFMEGYYVQGGGGGGTFVVRGKQTAIIVAGGGGGLGWPGYDFSNSNASGDTSGNRSGDGNAPAPTDAYGGTNGGGGFAVTWRGVSGGGGLIGDGQNSVSVDGSRYSTGGKSFINGGLGGAAIPYYSGGAGYGGFGGGGGAGLGYAGGGGGGGYSGGGAGFGYSNNPFPKSGGGGGSYAISTMNDNGAINTGHGSVTITLNPEPGPPQ